MHGCRSSRVFVRYTVKKFKKYIFVKNECGWRKITHLPALEFDLAPAQDLYMIYALDTIIQLLTEN